MPIRKLREFLDNNKIKYTVISHSIAYTAQEIAGKAHISGKEVAKTVMVSIDGVMAMAVLPASKKIDFDLLTTACNGIQVELANEEEFKYMFPDCQVGAMPPFGNLYDMHVWVDESLADDEDIAFNAGSHRELIKMKYTDFKKLVNPSIVKFSLS